MLDLSGLPREWLECRARGHRWDHGSAPLQVDDTQRPVVWVTRGYCTSCAIKRWRYLVPDTCARLGGWEYSDLAGVRRGLHLVTQIDADLELARRDKVGDEVGKKRAAKQPA
jgi:hypothetical protein